MIYNRTLDDVIRSREIVESKIKRFFQLTEEDISILERGCLTNETLNRIENQQKKLKEILLEMGYTVGNAQNKTFDDEDVFLKQDLERVVENTKKIVKSFFVFKNTPKEFEPKYHFEEFNKIEKILEDLEAMSDEIKSLYSFCGDLECGEVR